MTAVLLSAGITSVSAQAGANPQTEIILEPRRAAEGIDYDVYIENTRSLSTVIFTMEFTSKEKGTIVVSEDAIKYTVRECSILSFDKNKVNILSSNNRTADVIYALYDTQGRCVKMYKENIELKQGENEISSDEIDFGESGTISVMIWDGIDSMRPLADKTTINN